MVGFPGELSILPEVINKVISNITLGRYSLRGAEIDFRTIDASDYVTNYNGTISSDGDLILQVKITNGDEYTQKYKRLSKSSLTAESINSIAAKAPKVKVDLKLIMSSRV